MLYCCALGRLFAPILGLPFLPEPPRRVGKGILYLKLLAHKVLRLILDLSTSSVWDQIFFIKGQYFDPLNQTNQQNWCPIPSLRVVFFFYYAWILNLIQKFGGFCQSNQMNCSPTNSPQTHTGIPKNVKHWNHGSNEETTSWKNKVFATFKISPNFLCPEYIHYLLNTYNAHKSEDKLRKTFVQRRDVYKKQHLQHKQHHPFQHWHCLCFIKRPSQKDSNPPFFPSCQFMQKKKEYGEVAGKKGQPPIARSPRGKPTKGHSRRPAQQLGVGLQQWPMTGVG